MIIIKSKQITIYNKKYCFKDKPFTGRVDIFNFNYFIKSYYVINGDLINNNFLLEKNFDKIVKLKLFW